MDEKEAARAYERALSLLDMREHAAAELYTKLCRAFSAQAAAAAVARAQDAGLCSDTSFAQHWAASQAARGKSSRAVAQSLRQKGVDRAVIDEVLRSEDSSLPSDSEVCLALVRRKYAARLAAGDTEKVAAALARRGFRYADIKAAIAACGAEVAEFDD